MSTIRIFFITLFFVLAMTGTLFAQADSPTGLPIPRQEANSPATPQISDSLPHYLEVAARNNPGVKADFLAYKASLEKMPQAGAWRSSTVARLSISP